MGKDKGKENYLIDRVESYKKFVKKNPLKKVKKRVKQRTKKSPVTVESFFTSFPREPRKRRKEGSFSFLHSELKGVELKVTATPDAWEKIESFALDHPDWFGLEFHSCFAQPAVLEISEKSKPKPRGKQKKIYHLVNDIKIHASILYAFFSYWCRKPLEEWPDYLKTLIELIEMAKKDRWFDYIFKEKRGTNKPYRLTRYCIEKVYGETINSLGLKLFDDPKNFLKTYVHPGRRAERFTKLFGSKSPQEVATFPHTSHALKFIFESLEVI